MPAFLLRRLKFFLFVHKVDVMFIQCWIGMLYKRGTTCKTELIQTGSVENNFFIVLMIAEMSVL